MPKETFKGDCVNNQNNTFNVFEEVVEHACAIPTLQMGEYVECVASQMDCYSIRQPLGVVAGITPFNFPAMIPLWMFPLAIGCGNAAIVKPSERNPGAMMALAQLCQEAGMPPGVVNVVHGGRQTVEFLCDDPAIKAVSFVGSDRVGKWIYERATAKGKRVQANLGAKNHGVVLPDANRNATLNAIIGAAFGAAGQRCMALSTVILVGEAAEWIPELVKRAAALKVGPPDDDPNVEVGPLVSPEAKRRVKEIIQSAIDEGAKVLLDGRSFKKVLKVNPMV